MTYFTVNEDGEIKELDKPIEEYDCFSWPKVYRLALYHGPDASIFKMVGDGGASWEEVMEA